MILEQLDKAFFKGFEQTMGHEKMDADETLGKSGKVKNRLQQTRKVYLDRISKWLYLERISQPSQTKLAAPTKRFEGTCLKCNNDHFHSSTLVYEHEQVIEQTADPTKK